MCNSGEQVIYRRRRRSALLRSLIAIHQSISQGKDRVACTSSGLGIAHIVSVYFGTMHSGLCKDIAKMTGLVQPDDVQVTTAVPKVKGERRKP